MMAADERREDADLLHRIAQRDPAAISLLYDRYGGIAFALACRLLRNRDAAEDIVQEAFLNVWRRACSYDPTRGTVRTWLLTVVHHQAINHLRAVRSRGGAAADIDAMPWLAGAEDIAATVAAGMEAKRVRTALAMLPPEQREVIVLAYFGGMSHSEIAARDALPLGTVKGRMRLGLEKLRASLRSWEVDATRTARNHEASTGWGGYNP
ncbi:MAG: sigma-70 family RNA polymerase sigma factor [Thermomicrobiales bacterium]